MATVVKVRRLVANPHRRAKARRKARAKPRHNPAKRKLTAKQIKIFGTRRQKAALKAHRRRAAVKASAVVRRKVRARPRKLNPARKRRRANPALIVTLGAVNPRRKKVAQKRRSKAVRAANPRKRRRSRNPRALGTASRRNRTRRVISHRRRRNPELFGARSATTMAKMVVGGLAGVAAVKFIPAMVPAGMVTGNLMKVVVSGVAAFVAGALAKRFVGRDVGDAVLFGGLMQTGSVALNAFLPTLASQFGLTGRLGSLIDASYVVPENYLGGGIPITATPRVAGVSGIDRAFGTAL